VTTGTPTVGWRDLADRLHAAHAGPLPPTVVREAKRSLFNVLGVALGASRTPQADGLFAHATVSTVRSADTPSRVPGRAGWADTYHAALTTGFAAHLDDYDDTHLATVIHPGAACLGALWALPYEGEGEAEGETMLSAFALGCEAQLRLGMAVTPAHYDRGWHITGTCGVIGAAVTGALAAGAGPDVLALALRFAAAQTVGHREGFGTEVKPLHAGKAAANGLRAAARAEGATGLSAGESMTPFLAALADPVDASRLVESFGSHWELLANTYKPYPCGIVAHPGIDAAIDLARGQGVSSAEIAAVGYACHPLVPELMGDLDPTTGLRARFSAIHGVAAGLVWGEAGLREFGDEAAASPVVRAIREKITMRPDDRLGRDQATVTVTLTSGERLVASVREARGSLRRPLTDEELIAKVERLVTSVTGRDLWTAVDRISGPDGWAVLREFVTPRGADDA
jgi:2-methylcitrate dehydratase PrpD